MLFRSPAAGEKPKEAKPGEEPKPPAEQPKAEKEAPAKAAEKPPVPPAGEKPKEVKPGEEPEPPAEQPKAEKGTPAKAAEKPPIPPAGEKSKETGPAKAPPSGPAAKGPAGTAISQVFEERLAPPDEKALKDLPAPKEGESFFITLHPAYLEKSKFNVFSVDQSSENFKELVKSVELVGIKDPVLARLKPEGGLEILSGQRRHLAASALNYPVPTIIQKIDDADAKIIVADGNLHRDKISSYDLSRALRMKMEGMKQKSGRRKKGEIKTEELYSDEKLAQEMGMKVSKLNRIIRLSEATKDVCDRVDDNSLPLSIASAISFLKPENQDLVLHLSDMGYKLTNERVERMKKVEKGGKLNELMMRDILDDKDLAPKQTTPPPAPQQAAPPPIPPSPDVPRPPETPSAPSAPETPRPPETPNIPPAGPSVSSVPETPPPGPAAPPAPEAPSPGSAAPSPASEAPEKNTFKGEQERPEYTKVILAGDRLRKYFPDVSMTPREIEESVYDALEERRQRQIKVQQKADIFQKNKGGPTK